MEWYEYEYKKWGNGEWDRPIDTELMGRIRTWLDAKRPCIFDDCLAVPSGTRILGIHNAYMWNGIPRVLYSYKTEDGTAPGTALLRFLDEDISLPVLNLEPIIPPGVGDN